MSFSTWHCPSLLGHKRVSLVVRGQLTLLCARLTVHIDEGQGTVTFVPIRNAFLRASTSFQTRAAAVKQGVCSGEIRKKHDI